MGECSLIDAEHVLRIDEDTPPVGLGVAHSHGERFGELCHWIAIGVGGRQAKGVHFNLGAEHDKIGMMSQAWAKTSQIRPEATLEEAK